jgi:hypothetical protein
MNGHPASEVTIVDIRMPFLSMVIFMVKAAIAFIPAFVILSAIGSLVFSMVGGLHVGMERF